MPKLSLASSGKLATLEVISIYLDSLLFYEIKYLLAINAMKNKNILLKRAWHVSLKYPVLTIHNTFYCNHESNSSSSATNANKNKKHLSNANLILTDFIHHII